MIAGRTLRRYAAGLVLAVAAAGWVAAFVQGRRLDQLRRQEQQARAEAQAEILRLSGLYQAAQVDRDRVRAIGREGTPDAVEAAERAGATVAGAVRIETVEVPIPIPCPEHDEIGPAAGRLEPYDPPGPTPGGPPLGPVQLSATVSGLVAADDAGGFYLSGRVLATVRRGTWSHLAELPVERAELAVDPDLSAAWQAWRGPQRAERPSVFLGVTTTPGAFLGASWGRRRVGLVGQVLFERRDAGDDVALGVGVRVRF